MSTTALQIASFVNQLKTLSLSQREGIDNMITTVNDEATKEDSLFLDGVAFGAFLSWGVLNVERDILDSFKKIALALEPVGLDDEFLMISQQELFRPRATSRNIIPDLEEAKLIITRRLRVLDRIEKELLNLSEEEVARVYEPETLRQFQEAWENTLERLVR